MNLQQLCRGGIVLTSSALLNCSGDGDSHMYDLYTQGSLMGIAADSWCEEDSNTYVISLHGVLFFGKNLTEANQADVRAFGEIEVEHIDGESSICSRVEQVYPHAAIIAFGAYNIETEAFESTETYQISPSEFKRLWPLK